MARKSVWVNAHKKRGFKTSYSSIYIKPNGDQQFDLTPVNGGKVREYSSHQAAKRDGWVKQK